jgi:hypothetical protein
MKALIFASKYARAGGIRTIDELKQRLRSAWREDTSISPGEWSGANPAVGQCAVTALIVQDLFGGELLRGQLTKGTHYWNRLPNGQEVDLTAEQFPSQPVIGNAEERSRDYVLSFPATTARYNRLRTNLGLSPILKDEGVRTF